MSRTPLAPRSAYKAWTSFATRWADNDMFGHVNNVVHYAWFDSAVNRWLIEEGLLDPIAGNPIGLVVESGCRYASALSFPEVAEVGLRAERVGTSSICWRLGIFGEGAAEASAEGHFVHVYVDRDSRRPVPLPDRWREKLRAVTD